MGKDDSKFRANILLGLGRDPALMNLHDLLTQCQSNACPGVLRELIQALEDGILFHICTNLFPPVQAS